MDSRLESLFTFLCLVSGIYFTLLFLWYALTKIKQRDQRLIRKIRKNPKLRDRILQKRRDLRR